MQPYTKLNPDLDDMKLRQLSELFTEVNFPALLHAESKILNGVFHRAALPWLGMESSGDSGFREVKHCNEYLLIDCGELTREWGGTSNTLSPSSPSTPHLLKLMAGIAGVGPITIEVAPAWAGKRTNPPRAAWSDSEDAKLLKHEHLLREELTRLSESSYRISKSAESFAKGSTIRDNLGWCESDLLKVGDAMIEDLKRIANTMRDRAQARSAITTDDCIHALASDQIDCVPEDVWAKLPPAERGKVLHAAAMSGVFPFFHQKFPDWITRENMNWVGEDGGASVYHELAYSKDIRLVPPPTVDELVRRPNYSDVEVARGPSLLELLAHNGHLDVIDPATWAQIPPAAIQSMVKYVSAGGRSAPPFPPEVTARLSPAPETARVDRDAENLTLFAAAEEGATETVAILLDRGTDIHAEHDEALCVASQYGRPETVQLLLDRGADLHARNDYALRVAVENGNESTVKLLLERGANVQAVGAKEIDWAMRSGNSGIVEMLKAAPQPAKPPMPPLPTANKPATHTKGI